MSLFVLDTGILVGYIRGAGYAEYVERKFQASQPPNMAVVSIISQGELDEVRLDKIVPGTQYSVYFLLNGVIQHDLSRGTDRVVEKGVGISENGFAFGYLGSFCRQTQG